MKPLAFVCVFAVGILTGAALNRFHCEKDATLEFLDDAIALHVGEDVIVLPDEIAAAISLDINKHLLEKESQ